jgi:hypothetical protein
MTAATFFLTTNTLWPESDKQTVGFNYRRIKAQAESAMRHSETIFEHLQ